jgi:hypothetical protein
MSSASLGKLARRRSAQPGRMREPFSLSLFFIFSVFPSLSTGVKECETRLKFGSLLLCAITYGRKTDAVQAVANA